MSLTIEKTFTLEAPVETVWAFLTDPYRVVGCLPGAEITEKIDERTYAAAVTVKVGPVTATYKGRMQFERLDAAGREVELVGRGQDVKGKGGAEMRMVSRLRALGLRSTEVAVSSEVTITGRLAQFGRGMIEEVADQMFAQFAACVSERLEGAGTSAPAGGVATAAGGEAMAPSGEAAPAPARAAPFRLLPVVLKALGQWLTRPFRRRPKGFRTA